MRQISSMFPFAHYLDTANLITVFNLSLAFTSMTLAHQGKLDWAASVICLAALLDFLDGYVARTWLAEHTLNRVVGKQLDSFADLLNFSVAPSVVMLFISPSFFTLLVCSGLIVSGGLRLAVFAVDEPGQNVGYRGLPTTYAGLLFALAFQAVAADVVEPHELLPLTLIISALQITNLRFPKFKTTPTMIFIIGTFSISSFLLHS